MIPALPPRPVEDLVDAFLNGGCASFAYGAWLALGSRKDHGITVLIDDEGEPNFDLDEDDDCTRCAVHVYLSRPEDDFDAAGIRTPEQMADHYGLASYSIDGPFDPEEFVRQFCGDDGPFTICEGDVTIARLWLEAFIAKPEA